MADLFSTDVLTETVQSLIAAPQFFLSRFFPKTQLSEAEEIHFDIFDIIDIIDIIDKSRRLAPFVSPLVAGKIVRSNGFKTSTFKPAYVKDKRLFDSKRPFKRAVGEQIGERQLTAFQRLTRALALDLIDQKGMLDCRMGVMAAEALLTGEVTVSGEDYPSTVVDYQRDPALTFALPTLQKWDQPGISPLDHLQDWAQSILQKTGAAARDVVMPVDVWQAFREHPQIEPRLNRLRGTSTLKQNAQVAEDAVFMGEIDGFNIFVYAGWYVDDNDAEQPILPADRIVLSGAGIDGVRAFGAIKDEEAGFQALEYYPKSWTDEDPSFRYLLMQSAPLVVPTRVNASMSVTVL